MISDMWHLQTSSNAYTSTRSVSEVLQLIDNHSSHITLLHTQTQEEQLEPLLELSVCLSES